MLVRDLFPDLAAFLEAALDAAGHEALAATVPSLSIVDRCRCKSGDGCATFYTEPKPVGSYGSTHYNIILGGWPGLFALDVVNGRIACVEILSRRDMASALRRVLP